MNILVCAPLFNYDFGSLLSVGIYIYVCVLCALIYLYVPNRDAGLYVPLFI